MADKLFGYATAACIKCGGPNPLRRNWDRDALGQDRTDDPLCMKCRAPLLFDEALALADRQAAERVRLVEAAFATAVVKDHYTTDEMGWGGGFYYFKAWPVQLWVSNVSFYRGRPLYHTRAGGELSHAGFEYTSYDGQTTSVTIPEDDRWLAMWMRRSYLRAFPTEAVALAASGAI